MPIQNDVRQRIVSLFSDRPCWMIGPLSKQLDYAIPSVRRFLTQTGYYSSFTHNGRWYTLASIPTFGPTGLWFHRDIGFSRAGSLTNTLIELVSKSKAGMTAEQIGKMLRCRCHSVLVKLVRQDRLQRQKRGRSFVYVAADEPTANSQLQAMTKTEAMVLPAEIAVLVLVEYIQNPQAGFAALAKTISRRTRLHIESNQIEALFQRYGLKKTV